MRKDRDLLHDRRVAVDVPRPRPLRRALRAARRGHRAEAGRPRSHLPGVGRVAAEAAGAAAAGVPAGRARAVAGAARDSAQRAAEVRGVGAGPRGPLDVRRDRTRSQARARLQRRRDARPLGRGARHRRSRHACRLRAARGTACGRRSRRVPRRPRSPRATTRRRRRRSIARCSARRGTSSTASRSGDRTGSTSWPANWHNSVFCGGVRTPGCRPDAGTNGHRGSIPRDAPARGPATGPLRALPRLLATQRESHHVQHHRPHLRARLRGGRDRLRLRVDRMDPQKADRQRPDARDRRRDPGRCQGVPQPPVHDDRHRRRRAVRADLVGAAGRDGGRLPRRRGAVRPRRATSA